MTGPCSQDGGDLHKSASVLGLLCGINYLSFKQRPDLSDRMSPTWEEEVLYSSETGLERAGQARFSLLGSFLPSIARQPGSHGPS